MKNHRILKAFLYTMQDDEDGNYLVYARSEKLAEKKIIRFCELNELAPGLAVLDLFYRRDVVVV